MTLPRARVRISSLIGIVAVLAAAPAACRGRETYVPTPKSFHAAADTEVIGALSVPPDDERRVHLELREDLVIGGNLDDPDVSFHGLQPDVDVDADGNIYVTDAGNQRVQVYAPDGSYLRTIGRAGSGPGELRFGLSVSAIAAGTLAIKGLMEPAVQLFDRDGTYRSIVEVPGSAAQIIGLSSGFALLDLRYRDATPLNGVTFLPVAGEATTMLDFPGQEMLTALTAIGPIPVRGLTQAASIAPAPGDTMYVSSGLDYEIARVGADGAVLWILRVPWIPLPLTEEIRAYVRDGLERAQIPLQPNGIDWPDTLPSLGFVRSDGAGRLFAFPATFVNRQPEDDDPRTVPVDVYDTDGSTLLHARIETSQWAWQTARGPFVYGIRTDPDTGEWEVVRYRLDPDAEHLEFP